MPNLPLHPAIVHHPLGRAVVGRPVAADAVMARSRGRLRRAFGSLVGLQAVRKD